MILLGRMTVGCLSVSMWLLAAGGMGLPAYTQFAVIWRSCH